MKRRRLLGLPAFCAVALAWIARAKTQPVEIGTQEIITRVPAGQGNETPLFPEIGTEFVSLTIKNYRPEDAGKFIYYVAEVRKNGSGWGMATPTNDGVLTRTRAKRSEDHSSHPTQYYYFTVENDTGEKRYTFDIQNVSLVSFVQSLNGSLRVQPRGERPVRRSRPSEVFNGTFAENVTISAIQGDDLTLPQTLDRIRVEADCEVIQKDGILIIDSCG